jgi:hypothetical protein
MLVFDAAESLSEEQRVSQELLTQKEKIFEEKLSQHEVELTLVHSRYQNQVRLLEQGKEEAERSLAEVRSQLNRERAKWQEDVSAAQQQARVREVCLMVFKKIKLLKMTVFWDVSCSFIETDQCFRDSYCLHHQGELMMEAVSISETLVIFHKTFFFILTGMRT